MNSFKKSIKSIKNNKYMLAKLRMGRSAQLLRGNLALPIGKVAASVGIPDQRYFSRCFRRVFGVTPGEYRAGKLDK